MSSFVFPLSSPLGGDDSPIHIDVPVGTVAVAVDRLAFQFKDKANIVALLSALVGPTQTLDDVAGQLADLVSINDSAGVQLDHIGENIGEGRQGFDDATYRLHLKARILLNHSSGTVPEILALFEALLGSGALLTMHEDFPAALRLTVSNIALDETFVNYLVNFLREAKAGGVRAILEWTNNPLAATFTFAGGGGAGFDSGIFASAE
jgi:hypothetical protein